jgi:hypothetical protein
VIDNDRTISMVGNDKSLVKSTDRIGFFANGGLRSEET